MSKGTGSGLNRRASGPKRDGPRYIKKSFPKKTTKPNYKMVPYSAPRAPAVSRLFTPGADDASQYAAALADPFNAPDSVGILLGGTG